MKTDNIKLSLKTLGPRLRQERIQIGLGQKQLADMICISNTFLSDIEHSRATPSLETYLKLCYALSLNLSFVENPA